MTKAMATALDKPNGVNACPHETGATLEEGGGERVPYGLKAGLQARFSKTRSQRSVAAKLAMIGRWSEARPQFGKANTQVPLLSHSRAIPGLIKM